MADSAGEKKHEATPQRRQKAREKGQVARSQDLGSSLVLLLAVALLWWCGPQVGQTVAEIMRASFEQDRYWTLEGRSASGLIASSAQACLWALMPIMLGVCAIVLVNNWFQVGFLFLPDKLNLDWKRIDPLKGAQRLVALPNIARLGFGLLKIACVTAVIIFGLWGKWPVIMTAQAMTAGEIGGLVWNTTLDLCFRTALVLVILALLDYGFQWWKTEQDLPR